jgi:glycosyltransferase involved in cell wall biosynthesis
MKIRRVLFISNNRTFGGSEVLWLTVARELLARNYRLAFYVFRWPNYPEHFHDVFIDKRVTIYYRYKPGFFRSIFNRFISRFYDSAPKWVSFEPDYALISLGSHVKTLGQIAHCSRFKVPYSIIFQLVSELSHETNISYVTEVLSSRAAYFASDQNRKLLQRQIAADIPQAKIIYNAAQVSVDLPFSWPASNVSVSFAVVSRLDSYHKGLDILFEVLARPTWKQRNIQVNLYGVGGSRAYLELLCSYFKLSNVFFKGYVADVTTIWSQNCALVLPSRQEGMSLALIEAMLCGRVCITTHVGGAKELITHGVEGFVAEAATPDLLDQALEEAWQNQHRWKEIGYAAYEKVRKVISKRPEEVVLEDVTHFFERTT